MNDKEFYSNCLIEAIKAKLRLGKEIKIIHIKSKDVYFRGRIRIRPYSVYENFLKAKQGVDEK